MRKRIQFIQLFVHTFLVRHKKHIFLSALSGFLVTLFLFQSYPIYLSLFGRKLKRIGIIGRYSQTTIPKFIQNQLSYGLTSIMPNGEATASLALQWKVDPKGIEYTFTLDTNHLWHNGAKFSAKDIDYTLKGAVFTPVNDNTFKVTLNEPYAPLLTILSQPLFKEDLIGLGPYKVSKLTYDQDVISELTITPVDQKMLPTLDYKFYRTTNDALFAFKVGEIDSLKDFPDKTTFESWKNVDIKPTVQYDRFLGVFFNVKNSLFKDKEIRQALAYALPKLSDEEKAYSPISPLSWAYSQKIRLYNEDVDAAMKILSKSDLATSSNQITISTFAPFLDIAEKIADAWTQVGVFVKVKVENALPSDYQVALIAQSIPADPDQYPFWQSTQEGINITHYSNPKIDKLLEDGRKTLDRDTRKKIYADFQRYLVDDAPALFLYYPRVYQIERK